MDNLRLAISTPGKIAERATVNPCVVSLLQLSSLPWNACPVCAGITVQFAAESVSSLARNPHGNIDFHDEGGEKVREHVRSQARFLAKPRSEIMALMTGTASKQTATELTESDPFLLYFDNRILEPREVTAAKPEPESTIQPRPDHPGEWIDTASGEVLRGAGEPTFTRPASAANEKMLNDEDLAELERNHRRKPYMALRSSLTVLRPGEYHRVTPALPSYP